MDDWCSLLHHLAPLIAPQTVVLVDLTHGERLTRFPCPTPLIGLNKSLRRVYVGKVDTVLSVVLRCPHDESQMKCDLVYNPTMSTTFPYEWRIAFTLLGRTATISPCTALWKRTVTKDLTQERAEAILDDMSVLLGFAYDGSTSLTDMGHLVHFCGIADHVADCDALVFPVEEALRHMNEAAKVFERSHRNAGARNLGLNKPFVCLTVSNGVPLPTVRETC